MSDKVDPDAMQIALLEKLVKKISVPEGIVEPLHTITVTTEHQIITPPRRIPWYSVSVVNDGPDSCWIVVNTEKSSTTPYRLDIDETFEVDFHSPKIDDLMVWCESGSASLRIRGVR